MDKDNNLTLDMFPAEKNIIIVVYCHNSKQSQNEGRKSEAVYHFNNPKGSEKVEIKFSILI